MDDVKVLYAVEITESERGWGQRPEGYICLLTEEAAAEYIRRKEAEMPRDHVPAVYWSYTKRGYHEVHPTVHAKAKAAAPKAWYVDRLEDLRKPV